MAIKISKESYVLENQYLKKEIFLSKKSITSGKITNKLSGSYLDGLDSSEEFVLHFKGGLFGKTVKSSELKIEDTEILQTGALNKLTVIFMQARIHNSSIIIKAVYELSDFDRFFRKYLEISFDDLYL